MLAASTATSDSHLSNRLAIHYHRFAFTLATGQPTQALLSTLLPASRFRDAMR
jgi:hypothetical protein